MARNTDTIAQMVARMDASDQKLDALIGVVGDLADAIRGTTPAPVADPAHGQVVVVRDGTGRATPALAGARVVRRNAAGRLVDNKGRFVATPLGSATLAPIAVIESAPVVAVQAKAEAKAPKVTEVVTAKATCHPDRLAWTQKGLNCVECREAVVARKAAKV